MSDRPTATTKSGRVVVVCYCGGGDAHEWRPHGGGWRILACPSWDPAPKPAALVDAGAAPSESPFRKPKMEPIDHAVDLLGRERSADAGAAKETTR